MADDISLRLTSVIEDTTPGRIQRKPFGKNRIVLRISGMNNSREGAGSRKVCFRHGPPTPYGGMQVRIHDPIYHE